ncbi:glycerol-3-phosphate cytidylyltransferase [Roseovarius aestuarii]|nr:glycerol-3-phosphate cytidylyltransferase [Roseovarius aestuarii]
MKTVLTYGTFDTLHYGHIRLFERAKALGDRLIVGLSTDAFNARKGKQSHFDYEERKKLLEAIRYIDLIIPEHNWNQKAEDVKTHKVDVFTMGDDWAGKFDFLSDYCEVIYLSRTPDVSSTMIKDNIPKV